MAVQAAGPDDEVPGAGMSWSDNPESVRAHRVGCQIAAAKRSKYGNVKTTIGGEKFDSKREALRHLVLKDMEKHGEIRGLQRQPRFKLKVNGALICTYVGDWKYIDPRLRLFKREVVEDSKGVQTRDFRIKWKLCQALYPEIEWRLS